MHQVKSHIHRLFPSESVIFRAAIRLLANTIKSFQVFVTEGFENTNGEEIGIT